MLRELTEVEFEETFGDGMADITELEIDAPINIWNYVKILAENNVVDLIVSDRELVEKVYRSHEDTYDHILLPTEKLNVFLTIVIDLKAKSIFGHILLDVNEKYGID